MVDGCLITDKEAIHGCWADYFEDLSTAKDDPTFDNMHQNMVDIDVECIREKLKDLVPSEEISTDEVMRAIGKLNHGKASDKLGLAAEHIIHAAQSLAPALACLFTTMLKQGQIPRLLMDGYIIPIAKKGKDSLLQDNHRGITITNTIAKLLEHIFLNHIKPQLDTYQSNLQKGFTKGCSSTNAALLVTELINDAKDEHRELYLASLDAIS